jgi:hypothetical protein
LKNTTLEGLWMGASNNSTPTPTHKNLQILQETLKKEKGTTLLSRRYMYPHYSQEGEQIWRSTTLKDMVDAGLNQLEKHIQTIQKGNPASYNHAGIFDTRVKVTKGGHDNLQGYVVLGIGGTRVLVTSTERISTTFQYQRALQL